MEKLTGYIIGTYNKYETWDRKHARKVFELNENWYAIYQLDDELPFSVERDFNLEDYCQYKSFEAANLYVRQMKEINRR